MEFIGKYAKYYYEKQDKDLIGSLDEYLNKQAEDIYNFFDPSLDRCQAEIHIIPTKEEYDNIVKKYRNVNEVPKWDIGNTGEGIITYVSLNDYKNTAHAFKPEEYDKALEDYKKTLIHEYVHFVTIQYQIKNNINKPLRYLSEGIAQCLSHQRDNIKKDFNYSLEDILESKDCYIGFYQMTKYILDNYDKEYFFQLLSDKDYALEETPKIYKQIKKNN
jgi:hypothetical protein